MSEATSLVQRRPTRSLMRLLSCIRFDEVLILQGPPLLGACFSMGVLTWTNLVMLTVLILGNACLVAHVFALNDWSGIQGDLRDPSRAARVFTTKSVTRADLGYLTVALLVASWLAFAALSLTAAVLVGGIVGLSALYSAPGLHMKGMPVANSILHLVGGGLHFLLGFAVFAPLDGRAVAVAAFFALVFTAGHLMHEARGRDGDLGNEIRTNAVAFGQRECVFAGLILFTIAHAVLIGLAASGLLPRVLVWTAVLYPLLPAAMVRALRAGLSFDSLCRLQVSYRVLYALIGAIMVVASWLS